MRFRLGLKLLILTVVVAGCSYDVSEEFMSGYTEPTAAPLTFSATASASARMDGWPVFITGGVIPGYAENPDTLVQFGTFMDDHVSGTFTRSVWGNEQGMTVWFWAQDPATNRWHRITDITVNGVPILGSSGSNEWETTRSFSLFVENNELQINPDGPDSLVTAQVWYTGIGLPESWNRPADPADPMVWLGTWTSFHSAPHTMEFQDEAGMRSWTTTMPVKKGAVHLLRTQALNDSTEVRAGIFVGPVGRFDQAIELHNLRDLYGGYMAFEYRCRGDGGFENLRPQDERMFTISIGG